MNIHTTNKSLNKIIDELIILFEKKQFNFLIEKAKEKTKEFPKSFELYNLIGITFAEIKNIKQAFKYYQKALIIGPKNFISDFYLGSLYHDKNDLKNAIIHYKKSIKLNPNYFNSWFNLGVASNNFKKPYDAIYAYENAL